MWLCQIKVVRKAERSTWLELDGCQNSLCFFLENGHMWEDSLWPKSNRRSLSVKQDFLFPSFQHSSLFSLNLASFIPPEPKGISFDGTVMWVVCACLESVWPHQRRAEQSRPAMGAEKALRDPNLAQDSGPFCTTLDPGCNSPSVCGLGWRGGRGELQVSHGKACFIVCLREWRMEGREGEREKDGRRWGWTGQEGGWWLGKRGEEQGGRGM